MKDIRINEQNSRENVKESESTKFFDHDYGVNKQLSPGTPFALLTSPMRDCIDAISSKSNTDVENESNWIFSCVCNNRDLPGHLIGCDKCNSWMHVSCLKLDHKKLPDKYFCPSCSRTSSTKNTSTSHDHVLPVPLIPTDTTNNENTSDKRKIVEKSPEQHKNIPEMSSEVSPEKGESIGLSEPTEIEIELQCDCLDHINDVIRENPTFNFTHIYQQRSNKNCHSFTLKNGQKILKSSKVIPHEGFVIEMRGDVHILNKCSVLNQNYNTISSFLYNIQITPDCTIVVDVRSSNHFSRYSRRSCQPNCKMGFAIYGNTKRYIKPIIYSTEVIEKHQELTLPIDRTEELFNNYPNHSNKHHWQKYDYSSTIICQCRHRKRAYAETNSSGGTLCKVQQLKDIVVSIKGPSLSKKYDSKLSPGDDNYDTSTDDNNTPAEINLETEIQQQGLSREEKKLKYVLNVINKMEGQQNKSKSYNKRGRKPNKNNEVLVDNPTKKSELNNSISQPQTSIDDSSKTASPSEPIVHLPSNKIENVSAKSWYIPEKITKCILQNAEMISTQNPSSVDLVNHRKNQVPIKLALRRGLYHIAFNEPHQGLLYNTHNRNKLFSENSRTQQTGNRNSSQANGNSNNVTLTSITINPEEPPAKISNINSNDNERVLPVHHNLPPIPELRSTLSIPFSKSPPSSVKDTYVEHRDHLSSR